MKGLQVSACRRGAGLVVLDRFVRELAVDDNREEVPWIDDPREDVIWIAWHGDVVYLASRSAIDRYLITDRGPAMRTAIVPLQNGIACRPFANEHGISYVDGLHRLVSARFDVVSADMLRPRQPPVLRRADKPILPSFGGVPLDLVKLKEGFALTYAAGIVEVFEDGVDHHESHFPEMITGFAYASSGTGFARDQKSNLYAYRPGLGFSKPCGSDLLPRPFTYSSDLCFAESPTEYDYWLAADKLLVRVRLSFSNGLVAASGGKSIAFSEKILSMASDGRTVVLLLGRESYWAADRSGPLPPAAAAAPTNKAETRGVLPSRHGLHAVSRWQRIAKIDAPIDTRSPCLNNACIAVHVGAILIDTPESSFSYDQSTGLCTLMPSICRGSGARILQATADHLVLLHGARLIVTDRMYGVLRVARAAGVRSVSMDGTTVAWVSQGKLHVTNIANPHMSTQSIAVRGGVGTILLSGRTLWAAYGNEVVESEMAGDFPRMRLMEKAKRTYAFVPSLLAACGSPPAVAAARRNLICVSSGNVFVHDETISGIRFDGADALLAVGPGGITRFAVREGILNPVKRFYFRDDSIAAVDLDGPMFEGRTDSVRWFEAAKAAGRDDCFESGTIKALSEEEGVIRTLMHRDTRDSRE